MFLFFLGFMILGASSLTSCSKKTGCPINEEMGPNVNRKGELSMKRGKTNLFDKKTRKKRSKR